VRRGCLISQRGKTDGAGAGPRGRNPDRNLSLKNGPIPPCPTLLRPAAAGLRRAGRTGIFTHAEVAKAGNGDEGIRDSGVKGGPIPPCAVTAKANLPRRWVFR
jgi:hypothetical protein